MKNTIQIMILAFALSTIVISCKKDVADPTVDCSSSSSRDIEGFFNLLHSSSSYELYETMDLLTHEPVVHLNYASFYIVNISIKHKFIDILYYG